MIMEKEFVPYGLALKLKELGFDEPCFGIYCEGRFHLLYPNSYKDVPEDFYREVDAPTFSQAFRWFREKYGLEHHIWSGKISTVFYGYDILNIDEQEFVVNNSSIGGGDCDFDTYEESESACLDKLIEIVESK